MDEVVGDHAQPDPTTNPVRPFVEGTPQTMPALEDTDSALTAGAPFLKFFEPTLLLPQLSGGTFGVMTGNRYPLHSHVVSLGFVGGGEESRICRHFPRCPPELFDMPLQTAFEQGAVGRSVFAHLIVRNNLIFRLLHHH